MSSITFSEYLTSETSWNTRNHPGWAPSKAVYLTARDDFLHGGAQFQFPRFSGNSLSASDVLKLGTFRGTLHSILTATWGSSLQELLDRAKTTEWPFSVLQHPLNSAVKEARPLIQGPVRFRFRHGEAL